MTSVLWVLREKAKGLALKFGFYFNLERCTSKQDLLHFFNMISVKASEHGLIRVGGMSDGGYLIPNDLDGIGYCFSPGVSSTANFELELSNYGIHSFMADYSVDAPPLENNFFTFDKKYLGSHNDNIFITLDDWIKKYLPDYDSHNDMILQMDIEGAEYDVILSTQEEIISKFRVLVIEFHDLDGLFGRYSYQLIYKCFKKLLSNFEIVHIHPNNATNSVKYKEFEVPPTMEFTFLRKDRFSSYADVATFPHQLDVPNVLNRADIKLPECWY